MADFHDGPRAQQQANTLAQYVAAAASTAAQQPVRTGAVVNGGPIAATRHGSPVAIHNISPQHTMAITHKIIKDSGSEATRLTQAAHLQDRGMPRQDRSKQA